MREHSKNKPSIRELIMYYILSCLISWAIWLSIALNEPLGYNIPILSYQHYLASLGPILMCLIAIVINFVITVMPKVNNVATPKAMI